MVLLVPIEPTPGPGGTARAKDRKDHGFSALRGLNYQLKGLLQYREAPWEDKFEFCGAFSITHRILSHVSQRMTTLGTCT